MYPKIEDACCPFDDLFDSGRMESKLFRSFLLENEMLGILNIVFVIAEWESVRVLN